MTCGAGRTAAWRRPNDRPRGHPDRHRARPRACRSCRRSFDGRDTLIAWLAIVAFAVAAAPAALAFLAAGARLHHCGLSFLECLDPHGEVAQHILVDAHGALHLAHRRTAALDVEHDVMPFAVLLDAVGEV